MSTDPMLQDGEKLSINTFTGNGVTTTWELNFAGGYIRREHVKAYSTSPEGVNTPQTVAWPGGANTVSVTPAVPSGHILTIYRDTPKDAPVADFVDGAIVNETNLDLVAKQSVFVSAEILDRFGDINDNQEALEQTVADAVATMEQGIADNAADIAAGVSAAQSTANGAVTTANAAAATAAGAVTTANAASTAAGSAVTTANDVREEFDDLVESVNDIVGGDFTKFARTDNANTFTPLQSFSAGIAVTGSASVTGNHTVGGNQTTTGYSLAANLYANDAVSWPGYTEMRAGADGRIIVNNWANNKSFSMTAGTGGLVTFGGDLAANRIDATFLVSSGHIRLNGTNAVIWNGKGAIQQGADGRYDFLNAAGTSVSGLMLGPTDGAHTFIKRSGAGIDIRNSADSAWGPVRGYYFVFNGESFIGPYAPGTLQFSNLAATGFTGFFMGVRSADWPGIYVGGTLGNPMVKIRNATNTADADLTAKDFSATTIKLNGTLLGDAATKNVGNTAGTVAAGDDIRFGQGFTTADLLVTGDTAKTTPTWLDAATVYSKTTYAAAAAKFGRLNFTYVTTAQTQTGTTATNLSRTTELAYGLGLWWKYGVYFSDDGVGGYNLTCYVFSSPDLNTWTNRLTTSTVNTGTVFAYNCSNLAFSPTQACIAWNGKVYTSTGGAFDAGTTFGGTLGNENTLVAGSFNLHPYQVLAYGNSQWVLGAATSVYYAATPTGSWSSSASGITNAKLAHPEWTGSVWLWVDTHYHNSNRRIVKWNGVNTWTTAGQTAFPVSGQPDNGFQIMYSWRVAGKLYFAYWFAIPSSTQGVYMNWTADDGATWNSQVSLGSTTQAVAFAGTDYGNLVFGLDSASSGSSLMWPLDTAAGTLGSGVNVSTTSRTVSYRGADMLVKSGVIRWPGQANVDTFKLPFSYDPETQFSTPNAPTVPTGTVAKYKA